MAALRETPSHSWIVFPVNDGFAETRMAVKMAISRIRLVL
jgi:hypothetical protein